MGDGARLRWPLRARDADGRARAARDRVRGAPPRSGVLGGTPRAAGDLRRPPDARSIEPIAWPTPCGPRPHAWPRWPLDVSARRRPRRIPRLRLYLKREDLAHTGAHKINNALGQSLLTRRLGKSRVIAETGAGQHGVATATACALLDLPCVVYMGAEDIERQQPNVLRMRALGRRGPGRHVRHRHAQGRRQRGDARLGDERRDDPLRARVRDGTASVPDDRARPPAPHRRRGGGPADRGRGPPAGSRAGLRRGRVERDRPARPVHRRAVGPARGRRGRRRRDGRPGGTRPRSSVGHRASSTARVRSCSRTRTARSSKRTRPRPGSTTRASARSSRRSPKAAGSRSRRRRIARRSRRCGRRTRTEGILPALETAHAIAGAAQAPGRPRWGRWRLAGRPARPPRLLGSRRQGPRRARALRRCRRLGGRGVTTSPAEATAPDAASGTNDTAGARRIATAFERAHAEGRIALIPYIVAGYPDAETSFRGRPRRGRCRRGPARGRAAVLGPARGRCNAPARVGSRPRRRGHAGAVARADRTDRRSAARAAAGPDGLCQPGHRRWRRRGRGTATRREPARPA